MPGYQKRMSSEIAARLEGAEALGSCLPASDASLFRALRIRCRDGELVEPYPRLFSRPSLWRGLNPAERARHILLGFHALNPGWALGGLSASLLLGLQVPYAALEGWRPCIVSDVQQRTRSGKVTVCRHVLANPIPLDVESLSSQPIVVTDVRQTVFDTMRVLSFRHGLAVADSAIHNDLLSFEELVDFVMARKEGYRGARQARETAVFADGRSANGGESVARAIMHELGFAAPDLQVPFEDPFDPGHFYFADFVWRLPGRHGFRATHSIPEIAGGGIGPSGLHCSSRGGAQLVIGELDGFEKYFDPGMTRGEGLEGALLRERRRESRLSIFGSPIVRFTYGEALDPIGFSRLLDSFGVPRDHEPLIDVSSSAMSPAYEQVPLEAYGLD